MVDIRQHGIHLAISPERVTFSIEAPTKELLAADVRQLLVDNKVTHGIDDTAIANAIAKYSAGQNVKNIPVVLATLPTAGESECLDQLIAIDELVVPGETIAIKKPGVDGEPGCDVFGQAIPPKPFSTLKLEPGENTIVNDDQLVATHYGVVAKRDNKVHVDVPIYVAPNKLSATMDVYAVSAGGTPVSYDHIADALMRIGIIDGIDQDAILAALEEAQMQRKVMRGVPVAFGVAPVAPAAADVEFFFKINNTEPKAFADLLKQAEDSARPEVTHLDLVEEGAVIAKELPASAGTSGKNIYGEMVVPPSLKQKGYKPPDCGANVEKNPETLEYIATALHLGYAQFEKGKLTVLDPITIAEDEMSATLTVYPSVDSENQLTENDVVRKLTAMGVTFGVDNTTIKHALEQAQETQVPVFDRVVAKGRQGKRGTDAFLEYVINVEKAAGKMKEDGTMDFRDRGAIINVKNKDPICTRIPPTPGDPAVTITGETIPATSGVDVEFKAGEHCNLKENTFYATDAGAVFVKDNVVHVTEVYQVDGDVDLNTGNLFQRKGCINVSGSVQSGFEVKANGHILVKNNVENGQLIAGGNVNIGNGIVQPEGGNGYVHSVGDVAVKFAQNAKIFCYQDIEIGNSSMSSQLHAKGSIFAIKGKGCIIGGVAKAGKTIRAKTLGSPAAAYTHIEIEVDPKINKQLNEDIKKAEEAAKIDPEQKALLSQLIKKQREMYETYREQAEIIVDDVIYPGVVVKILDVTKKITEEARRTKITLAPGGFIKFSKIE